MRRGHISLWLLAGFVVVVCAAFAASGRAEDLGLDVWNIFSEEQDLQAALNRKAHLEEIRQEGLRRGEAMDYVIAQLSTGQISLEDAASELELINQGRQNFGLQNRDEFPEATDHELYARLAVIRVKHDLDTDPSRSADIVPKLEAELEAILKNPK